MINMSKPFSIDEYREIFLRRLNFIIPPFLAITLLAAAYAWLAPSYYEAKTVIIASPQRIPREFVKTTVPSLITEQLNTIEQEVKSRTRLEQIIREFDLQANAPGANMTELVESLRKNITVQVASRRGRDDTGSYFSIGYVAEDPVPAAMITNRLSELFIEENLKIREQQASGTTDFLKDELRATKRKLERQENIVSKYKKQHMGELPEQKDVNIRMLDQLQQTYQRVSENLRSAQDRQIIVQKQISELEYPVRITQDGNANTVISGSRDAASDTMLKSQYAELKSKYKPDHPDLKRLKKKIEEIEATAELDIKNSPRYKELANQLTTVDLEIRRLRDEEARIKGEMEIYRGRIERTTEREQELAALTREYQNTKTFYDGILNKSHEALQAENLERRQKGEQFRVIDPATPPEVPVRPKRDLIVLMGLGLGVLAGLALGFIREQMDHSFHDPEDVELSLGIRSIANIPHLHVPAKGTP